MILIIKIMIIIKVVAASAELWGIFQPYAHLSSCRTAKVLEFVMITCWLWSSLIIIVFPDRDILRAPWQFQSASTLPALTGFDSAPLSKASRSPWRRCSWSISQNSDLMITSSQVLLTTCVGSKEELEMLVTAASQFYAKYYQHSGSATPAKVSNIVNMRRMVIMITL